MKNVPLILVALFLLLQPLPTAARLGGGSSFSSGRSSYSSSRATYTPPSTYHPSSSHSSYSSDAGYSGGSYSSSSSASEESEDILLLIFIVMLFLAIMALMLYGVLKMVGSAFTYTTSRSSGTDMPSGDAPFSPLWRGDALEALRHDDPNFSEPAFREFAGLLYERFYEARPRGGNLDSLNAYIQASVLTDARDLQLTAVNEVLVGGARLSSADNARGLPRDFHGLQMEFEATYAVERGSAREEFYTVERWLFGRAKTTLSKDPEAMLKLGCPACGNPGEIGKDGKCPFCDQIVNRGNFQWKAFQRTVVERMPKPPMKVPPSGGRRGVLNEDEVGVDYPTVYPANFAAQQRAFAGRHPDFSWDAMRARVEAIFLNLQEAWSSLEFERARPFETDVLYDTHRYWIERYKSSGLRNRLEQVKITRVVPCRIEFDAFYEIYTVRIFASMVDYVVDREGKVVSGDRDKPRVFSEYWTFIRRVGASRPAFHPPPPPPRGDPAPPTKGPATCSTAPVVAPN